MADKYDEGLAPVLGLPKSVGKRLCGVGTKRHTKGVRKSHCARRERAMRYAPKTEGQIKGGPG